MRPSFLSALWIVAGVCTVATSIGVLVGLMAEWSVISGALSSGPHFDLVLFVEATLVAMIVVLLFGATRRPRLR